MERTKIEALEDARAHLATARNAIAVARPSTSRTTAVVLDELFETVSLLTEVVGALVDEDD